MSVKLLTDKIVDQMKKGEITPEAAVAHVEKLGKAMTQKRTYLPPSIEDIKLKYATNLELRRRALASKIPFIDPAVGNDFRLTQGLILIGGVSGQGKSTVLANIIAGFIKANTSKKAMVITNEETTGAVYDRVACILLKYSFKEYYNGRLSSKAEGEVQDTSRELMHQMVVEEGSDQYDMTCLEDVQSVLVYIANSGCGIGALDYLQTVTWSREDESLDPVRVSKKLGFFLKDYGRKVEIPVPAFLQLRDSDEMHFKDRVENDRTIFNHAVMAIEIVPDFATNISKFKFLKDRFGDSQGKEIEMKYVGGRFEYEDSL